MARAGQQGPRPVGGAASKGVGTIRRSGEAKIALGTGKALAANDPDPAPVPAGAVLRLHVVGPVRADVGPGSDCTPPGRRARAILAYMACSAGAAVPRSRIAAMIWERVPERQAKASLRQALYEIGDAVSQEALGALLIERDTLQLDLRRCWIDVAAAERDTLAGLAGGFLSADGQAGVDQILEGLDGISEAFDYWLTLERARISDRLRDRFTEVIETQRTSGVGAAERAALARQVLGFDPCHEAASRGLMRALLEQGDAVAAVREFERFKAVLKSRLEAQPSRETSALIDEALRSGGRGVESQAGPAPAPLAVDLIAPAGTMPAQAGGAAVAAAPTARRANTRIRLAVVPPTVVGEAGVAAAACSLLGERLAGQLARFATFDVVLMPSLPEVRARRQPFDLVLAGTLSISKAGAAFAPQVQLLEEGRHVVWTAEMVSKADPRHQSSGELVRLYCARITQGLLMVLRRQAVQDASSNDPRTLLLRAQALAGRLDAPSLGEASRLLDAALARLSDDAALLANAALVTRLLAEHAWGGDVAALEQRADDRAREAMASNPEHPDAHLVTGLLAALGHGDLDGGLAALDQAIEINPSAHLAFACRALVRTLKGDGAGAGKDLRVVRVLAPNDPMNGAFEVAEAFLALRERRHGEAVQAAQRLVRKRPGFAAGYKVLVPALVAAGSIADARRELARLRTVEPAFTLDRFVRQYALEPAGLAAAFRKAYAAADR